jgi:hypothetical protein
MSKYQKPRVVADLLDQEMEQALNPGVFTADLACSLFVADIDDNAAGIAKAGKPEP